MITNSLDPEFKGIMAAVVEISNYTKPEIFHHRRLGKIGQLEEKIKYSNFEYDPLAAYFIKIVYKKLVYHVGIESVLNYE